MLSLKRKIWSHKTETLRDTRGILAWGTQNGFRRSPLNQFPISRLTFNQNIPPHFADLHCKKRRKIINQKTDTILLNVVELFSYLIFQFNFELKRSLNFLTQNYANTWKICTSAVSMQFSAITIDVYRRIYRLRLSLFKMFIYCPYFTSLIYAQLQKRRFQLKSFWISVPTFHRIWFNFFPDRWGSGRIFWVHGLLENHCSWFSYGIRVLLW